MSIWNVLKDTHLKRFSNKIGGRSGNFKKIFKKNVFIAKVAFWQLFKKAYRNF